MREFSQIPRGPKRIQPNTVRIGENLEESERNRANLEVSERLRENLRQCERNQGTTENPRNEKNQKNAKY